MNAMMNEDDKDGIIGLIVVLAIFLIVAGGGFFLEWAATR